MTEPGTIPKLVAIRRLLQAAADDLCLILGADWEWRFAVSCCRQMRSKPRWRLFRVPLTCWNLVKQRLCWPVLSSGRRGGLVCRQAAG